MRSKLSTKVLTLLILLLPVQSPAEEIRVAVASNFRNTMTELKLQFESSTGHQLTLIVGSTGKQYAQIVNGAPFDAFFAADVKRPTQLELDGVAISDSRFTYAIGKLALWSPQKNRVDSAGLVLEQGEYRHLSLANPRLAPYGSAAREVLLALGLWEQSQKRLVFGENITQAFQFVSSGNAELGFVSQSQLFSLGETASGSVWHIPQSLYQPIEQQAVLLKNKQATRELKDFMQGPVAMEIIRRHGYSLP
jgi:molybdate transport system substrate-binding protein